jgi:hypothetical protein
MRKLRFVVVAVAGAAVAAGLAGCAGNYGSIQFDVDASRTCESGQVLPGYKYYLTGSDTMPDAILGLREASPQGSGDLWRPVPTPPETLPKLVGKMRGTRNDGPTGSYIADHTGTRIGIWCSYLKPGPVKILDDGSVIVPLPQDPDVMRGPGMRGKD